MAIWGKRNLANIAFRAVIKEELISRTAKISYDKSSFIFTSEVKDQ